MYVLSQFHSLRISFYVSTEKPANPVFSDSKSVLEVIRNGKTNLTKGINSLLSQINKPCSLQWLPTQMDIEENESADIRAKKPRDLDQSLTLTSEYANAVAKRRIFNQPFKKLSISDINCSRSLSSITARFRTGHFRGMKISPDGN